MSATKVPDFDSVEYDTPDVLAEDAWVAAEEEAYDAACRDSVVQFRQQLVAQHAVETCIKSCLECLSVLHVSREAHALSDIALSHNNWNQEPEPEPCSRDAWLRGAIPEEPAPKPNLPSTPPTSAPKPNSSSRDRPFSTHAQRKGASITGSETASGRRTSSLITRTVTPPLKPTTAAPTTSTSSTKRTKQLTPEQKEAEDNLRQELQIRRQQEALLKSLRQKDVEARTQLAALQKEIKGKEYTYGPNGQVIFINRPNPEHLPGPPVPHVKVAAPANASSAGASGSPSAANRQQARRSSGGTSPRSTKSTAAAAGGPTAAAADSGASPKPGNQTKPGSGARDQGNKNSTPRTGPALPAGAAKKDYIELPSKAQPPVIEVVKPSLGVTLRVGNSSKLGPKTDPNQPSRPTRQQFQVQAKSQHAKLHLKQQQQVVVSSSGTFTQQQQQQPLATQLKSVAGGLVASQQGKAAAAAAGERSGRFQAPASALAATNSMGNSGSGGFSSNGISKVKATSSSSSGGTALNLLATLPDTTIGGLPLNAVPKATAGVSSSGSGSGNRKAPTVLTSGPDVNLALTAAADWGQVTGGAYEPPERKQVARPGDKQLREEVGRLTHLPKMRAPIATLKPPPHQPAPTTGSPKATKLPAVK